MQGSQETAVKVIVLLNGECAIDNGVDPGVILLLANTNCRENGHGETEKVTEIVEVEVMSLWQVVKEDAREEWAEPGVLGLCGRWSGKLELIWQMVAGRALEGGQDRLVRWMCRWLRSLWFPAVVENTEGYGARDTCGGIQEVT